MNLPLPHSTRRHAFLLVDLLVYMAVLVVILTLAFEAFYRAWDYSKRLTRNAGEITRALNAGERWRADVRSAAQPPNIEHRADASVLRLLSPTGEVRYVFAEGSLVREQVPGTNRAELLAGVKSSRMFEDQRSRVTAWRWELELQSTQRLARVKPVFTFLAVPRSAQKP